MGVTGILAGLLVAGSMPASAAGRTASQPRTVGQVAQDWPTFLHDNARSSSSGETILSPATVPYLQLKWAYTTGAIVAASPAVVGGVVYVGSWDGNQYALNGATGAVIWKTPLGTTQDPVCAPPNMGITSSPTVANGVVYVGGGDSYWYALNAASGAVLWKVFTGLNTQAGAHYNWSSPLIVGNFAYIGIASTCDAPLVQGQLLKVDLTTHQVVGTANMVPTGQVGGGIWTTPTYDAATGRVFVSTGTLNLYSQQLSQAIVSVNSATMAIVDHWQLPFEAAVSDSDWGTTPTLTTDSGGRQLLSVANKNGILYTLQRNNLGAGPVWQKQIAIGGDCPTCGDGTIASGSFANGVLYYAGGNNVDANGIGHGGSVTAFNPGTGQVLWYHPTNQPILGSIVQANGVIYDPQGQVMEALDAATGNSLWTYKLAGGTYAAPAISNGIVYIGGVDSQVHAFGLPATLPPPPADPNCPAGFTCQDIGNPGIPGREQVNADGSVTVTASGNGRVQGDQMRIITTPASGDFQASVRDLSQTKGNLTGYQQPQLGIVIRQSAALGAPFYSALQDPAYPTEGEAVANVIMFYRDTWGGPVVELTQSYPQAFPRYIMVQRHGDTFQTLFSIDNVHYTLISGTVHTIVMPTTVLAGMGIGSGDRNVSTTAVYSNFSIAAPTQTYVQQNEKHPCPAPWSCTDVGAGSPMGDQTLSNGTWTLQSGGTGIAKTSDVFHLVYQKLAGDGTISARLTSLGNTSPQSQATVLMRADASMSAPYYGVVINPSGAATVQWRLYNGVNNRVTVALPTQTWPAWFRVSRYTDTTRTPSLTYYSALTSGDGTTWSQVPGSTVAVNLGAAPIAGFGGSSLKDGRTPNPSTWDNLAISNAHDAPPGICPAGFTCTDVGTGYQAGSQSYNNGTWNFAAGGSDIWDVYDMFHFAYQPLAADGTFSARVVSVGPTKPIYDDQWQKSGVMLRQSADPQSPYYGVFVTPQHGVVVQWRTTQAGLTGQVAGPTTTPVYPIYLMVGRWTDPHPGGATYYTAYTSADNRTFTAIPGSTMALSLPGPLLAGIAADSYQEKFTLPVSFDNVAIFNTEPVPPGACPTTVAGCADIGGATPAGTQSLTNGTLTMTAGGGDIWAAADQLHLVWQNLTGDGVVSARVASQQNTGPWAKAGVMMRATTDANSPYYGVFVTPSNGVAVQYRSIVGANTSLSTIPGHTPLYLRVGRYTNAAGTTYYTAYTSADGTAWSVVPNSTVSLTMPSALLAGWAADANTQAASSQVSLDHLAVTSGAPAPPGLCAAGWSCADLGGATPAGGQSVSGSSWTVSGGGGDIWGNSDQFRFASHPATADGTVSAQVATQQAVDPWSKAGVMMRGSADPKAPYYAIFTTPGHGVLVQWRPTLGALSQQLSIGGAVPLYVEVSRWTDSSGASPVTYYSALTSADGTIWTAVPGSTVALTLQASYLKGIAVSSHNTTQLGQATLNAVTLGTTSVEPAGACSAAFTCADIGGATPAGTQNQSPTAWSVLGGGGDIWGTADQLRLISQPLSGDGAATSRVVSLTNTNAYTKAGLMIRADATAGSAYYAVLVTPGNGLTVQYRPSTGVASVQLAALAGANAPVYLRITRTGTTVVASTSRDGTTWTVVPGSSITLPNLAGTVLAGLAVSSHDTSRLAAARFDFVTL